MIKKIFVSILSVSLFLACSEESKIKEVAIEAARAQYQAEIRDELAKNITGKNNLQKTATLILLEKADFEVQKSEIQGDNATVDVQVQRVPAKAKQSLIDIMSRLDEKKEARFNVPDALKMIYPQVGLEPDEKESAIYKIKLKKEGSWKALPSAEK